MTKKISKENASCTRPTGRGRPRAFDLDDALDTALRLFHRRGYDAVGVAELGDAIGIKPPSLYAAFGSKRQLFERVLWHYLDGEDGWMGRALNGDDDLAGAVAELLTQAAARYTASPDAPGCLVLESAGGCDDERVCDTLAALCAATRKTIRDRIKRDRPSDAERLTDYVTVTLYGLSAGARRGMTTRSLKRAAAIAAAGFATQLADAQ